MADRKTVVDALERCARLQDAPMSGECAGCAYRESFGTCGSLSKLMMDAAGLLKEEPVVIDGNLRELEPVQFKVTRQDKSYPFWDSVCTGCGYKTSTVKDYWKYCPVCGRVVKWE